MKVNIIENSVNIDEGKLVIAKVDGAYYVRAEGFANIETSTDDRAYTPTVQYDPHYYVNGGNGLTLESSAERALDRVIDMIDREGEELSVDQEGIVFDVIKDIIADRNTAGRHSVYTLAGGILKGVREGSYKGVPFAWIFKGIAEGVIAPTPAPAQPLTIRDLFKPVGA